MILLGTLLAGLIAFGVLSLKPSTDGDGVLNALLLGPVGVVVTGNDDVELRSVDSLLTVVVPAGSVTSPITLVYRESGLSEAPGLPLGFISTGRFFELSAQSIDTAAGPVKFQQMISMTMVIGPNELALAGNDYSRFFIQHYLNETMSWDVLPTTADLRASTVMAQVGSLSRFALTVGPSRGIVEQSEPKAGTIPADAAPSAPTATVLSVPTQISPAAATLFSGAHCTSDANAGPDPSTNSDAGTDRNPGSGSVTNADRDPGSDYVTNADRDPGSYPDASAGRNPCSDSDTCANAHSSANCDALSDTNAYAASLCIRRPHCVSVQPKRKP